MSEVVVRFFAAAREAAGCAETRVASGGTLAEVIAALATNPDLAAVLARSTFLVDGARRSPTDVVPPPGATIDVLPPFAGG